ncbi:serine/threonine protein kinase [Actinomadura yumaensis]
MTSVTPVPYRDPESAVMPERLGDWPPPKLKRGELVGGQYHVRGCLRRGGLGWIYLAHDNNVGHWVVLKGLLHDGADVSDLPEAERAALAAVNHPNIVKIHNFVRHPAPAPGAGPEEARETQSYIVMEYVGGRSLKELLDDRRRAEGPDAALPIDHVIAYGIEMLRALGYLHTQGLLYCDLKPDNVMQCEQRLTLIDLGGTWRMGGPASAAPIWGTPGFGAPEVGVEAPTVSSDLYTVGRTMAVLSFRFDFTGDYATGLPPREDVPLLSRFDSYDRLLRRATHPDPRERFGDAAEMAEQLFGVLREVVSVPRNAEPWPVPSTLFGRERRAVGAEVAATDGTGPVLGSPDPAEAVTALPVPVVSAPEEAAGLAELAAREPKVIVETLSGAAAQPLSAEQRLVLAGAQLDRGHHAEAARLLDELADGADRPDDWRIGWYRGVGAIAVRDCARARELFDRLYSRMPGEAAPKLALAFCCEATGDRAEAARLYESVWRTDRGYLSAAFGLARVRLDGGDRDGAVRVLDEVPSLSTHYGAAQLAAMAVTLRGGSANLTKEALRAAARRLEQARVDGERKGQLVAEILEAGLEWVRANGIEDPGTELIGTPLTQNGLRDELESTYRMLVRFADDTDSRYALVDKANAVRTRTLF